MAKRVAISGGALAGLADAIGKGSGATVIRITSHELMDMALSGQAYSLDGRYNFKDETGGLLRKLWKGSGRKG